MNFPEKPDEVVAPETMGPQYTAFISYRHLPDDQRWAQWLVEALERFETPEPMVEQGVPPRIGRVFRDDNELPTSEDLDKSVTDALYASKHVIVVCSPQTPISTWIRTEIELFKHWDRGHCIHVLLVAGELATACPSELRHNQAVGEGKDMRLIWKEPLAASVIPNQVQTEAEAKELAIAKLAASLLGCELNPLLKCVKEHRDRQTQVRYFHAMVRRWAVPQGICELTPEQVGRRAHSLRFESVGGVLQRVLRINAHHLPAPDDDGITQWDISYRADGKVEAVDHRNRHGDVKLREVYNRRLDLVDFQREDDTVHAQAASLHAIGLRSEQESNLGRQRTEIGRHLLEHNADGYVTRLRYARHGYNTPVADANGNYGEGFDVDANGLTRRRWFIDANGTAAAQRDGVAAIAFEYDELQRRVADTILDQAGKPIPCAQWYAKRVWKVDGDGNDVEEAYIGIDGQPTLHKEGYARRTTRRDERGNAIEVAYFGVDGQPTLQEDGVTYSRRRHDERGNEIERAYFGVDGQPTLLKGGFARWTTRYDERDNAIENAYFGVDGQPTLHKDGFACSRRRYDERGNVVEVAYFGVDGQPTLHKDGYARWTTRHDERGNAIENAYFGVDGQPTLLKDGFACSRRRYNERGNVVEVAYFGVDGQPTLLKDGYARLTYRYDERGECVQVKYFDLAGRLLDLKKGIQSEVDSKSRPST